MFLFIYKGQTVSSAELQRRHLKGGNKNELVICLDKDLRWCRTFSWADDKTIEVSTNSLFVRKDLTMQQKISTLYNVNIKKHWKRKDFEDFNYIDVQLSNRQFFWIYLTTLLFSIVALWVGVVNDTQN